MCQLRSHGGLRGIHSTVRVTVRERSFVKATRVILLTTAAVAVSSVAQAAEAGRVYTCLARKVLLPQSCRLRGLLPERFLYLFRWPRRRRRISEWRQVCGRRRRQDCDRIADGHLDSAGRGRWRKLELSATLPVCRKKIYADATVAGPLGGIYPNVAAFCLLALAIRIKLRT